MIPLSWMFVTQIVILDLKDKKDFLSSNINEVVRTVLNFLFFFS